MNRLLTIAEVAGLLGLSPRTLYNQRYRGERPGSLGVRVGGVVRYRPDDLDAWLDAQRTAGARP